MALSNRDVELFIAAHKSMKSELIVDYTQFATRGGFKNSNSAKAAWHAVKKKIDKLTAEEGEVHINVTENASPAKKRKTGDADMNEGETDEAGEIAAKKPKATRGKGKAKKGNESGANGADGKDMDHDADDEADVKAEKDETKAEATETVIANEAEKSGEALEPDMEAEDENDNA